MSSKQKKQYILLSWLLVILCMAIIFDLSHQPGSVSDNESKGIIRSQVEKVIGITGSDVKIGDQEKIIGFINSIARGYMHGFVFFLLGALVMNAMLQGKRKFKYNLSLIGISAAICLAYALADEVHQLFIPGRTFQADDIAMDLLGSIIGIALLWLIYYRRMRKRDGSFKATW